jgi:thiamine-phosphate pyrophosphorylase
MNAPIPRLPRLFIVSSGLEHLDSDGLSLRQAAAIPKSAPVMFQMREKGLDAARQFALAQSLRSRLDDSGSILLVNERADIALAAGAEGFHLPESSCPAAIMRSAFPGLLAGQSVHSVRAARDAEKSGVAYLLFGPVFATPSKERFGPPQGLEELGRVCEAVSLPVYAVGGITPERSYACIEKGAWGVAAITPFLDPRALPSTIETFRSHLPS